MTRAIEELEKLAKSIEDANTDDLSQLDLADRLRAIATRLRAEVRERERKAYYEGWTTGCVSPAMTQDQIKAAALRRYKEA